MKALAIVVLLIAVLGLVGWLSFDVSGDRPSVTVEKPKIEQDIDAASEAATSTLKKATDATLGNDNQVDEEGDVEVNGDSADTPEQTEAEPVNP